VFLTRYQEGLRKRRKPDEMLFLSTEDEKCVNKKVLGLIYMYVCLWKFVIIDLQSWFLV